LSDALKKVNELSRAEAIKQEESYKTRAFDASFPFPVRNIDTVYFALLSLSFSLLPFMSNEESGTCRTSE